MRVFFLTILLLIFTLSHAHALEIRNIRIGAQADKTRIVLEMDSPADYRAFLLPDPHRLIVDLPDFRWAVGAISQSGASPVRGVRHGALQPGTARIVFDLSGPVSIRTAFSLPAEGSRPARVVIDIAPAGDAAFRQGLAAVHGTRNPDAQKTAITPPQKNIPSQDTPREDAPPRYESVPKNQRPLVVIDPGHGGDDPGAMASSRMREKDVTLAIARELAAQLENSGRYRTLLTRKTDVFIKLRDRVAFARKHDADLFVSIHADSIDKHDVRGASVYTLSEKASDAQTEKLAARENRADLIGGIDLSTEDQEVANILVDLAMRDTMNQSKYFAEKLTGTFRSKKLRLLDGPHRHAGFAVLKAPDIPSVLIEAGFMSNRSEAAQLGTPGHRKTVATAIRNGIDLYFEQVRKKKGE